MQILVIHVFLVTIVALLWHHKSKGYFELTEELGCHNSDFRLTCKSANANLVIFEAIYSQNDSFSEPFQSSCGNSNQSLRPNFWKLNILKNRENIFHRNNNSNGILEINFRHVINKRCSGVNYCSFILNEDFEESSSFGPGFVYLRYACVEDLHFTRACNSDINASIEGFIKSPGYPGYYVGESSCLWTLKTSPPQRVKVTFLDVSLRGLAPHEGKCLDWLIVSENGLNLLSTCGDILQDTLILSDGSALNVSFKTSSKTLFPKRGILFHYKAVGCPFLRKPQDGYLINKNETFAHFRCCLGFVFPDTMSRDKIFKCLNENTWDGEIIDCVNYTKLIKGENYSNETNQGNLTAEARAYVKMTDNFKDVIIPSIVMCVLFVGNGIILYIIYLRRKKLAGEEKIELKELPSRECDIKNGP